MEKLNLFLEKHYNKKGLSYALIVGIIVGSVVSFLVGKKKNTKKR